MIETIVNVGTKSPTHMTIDIDEYGSRQKDAGLSGAIERDMFNVLVCDMNRGNEWISDGTRNRFAVNNCIALWVLGYNPREWFRAFLETHHKYFYPSDIEAFIEHVDRVSEYLEKWGPIGSRDRAIDFMIE